MPSTRRSGTRVAVVEQQEIFRVGLRLILDGLPLVVLVGEASNAADAVGVCTETQPDVILLDWAVPDEHGRPLIRHLRRVCPRTVIIVLSSDRTTEAVLSALGAGAAGYLLKTAPRDQLASAIDRAIAGEAFVDPALAGRVVVDLSRHDRNGAMASTPDPLTRRELEVLAAMSRGRSNKEIGVDLQLATGTVKIHVEHILRKLSASNRVEAATRGLRYGLIPTDDGAAGSH